MAVTRNIFDVQRAVRVVLDQNKITDQLLAVGDVDTLAIDDMIRDAIPRAIRAVLLVAPGVMIDDAVSGIDDLANTKLYGTIVADTDVKFGSDTTTYMLNAGTRVELTASSNISKINEKGQAKIALFKVPAGTLIWNKDTTKQVSFEEDKIHATGGGAADVYAVLYSSGGGVSATIKGDIAEGFYASITLPDNFLRLLSLQMSDWDYAVDHATPRGDTTYAIQHSNVYSLRGNPHRPVACITPDGKTLEAFGCSDANQTVTSFNYVAIPEIDTSNNTINISDKLYPSVIYYCASLVCTSLGDFNKATAMERIAMQYVTINTNTNREIQSE